MSKKLELDFDDFLEESISELSEGIDIDYRETIPKKSEEFVEQVLKDTSGKLVKNEPIHTIMHKFVRKARRRGFNKFCIGGGFSLGKCFGKGTKVLMYDLSIKNIENIKIHDVIMGNDGTPRNVLGLGGGTENLYKITLENDDSFVCNKSHIMSFKILKKYYSAKYFIFEVGEVVNIELGEWLSFPDTVKKECFKLYKSSGLSLYKKELPEDPYTFGSNLDYNDLKSIPKNYLHSSREDRIKLLSGVLDSSGCVIDKYYKWCIDKISLKNDFLFLCRSLGIRCSYKTTRIDNKNYYVITIEDVHHIIPVKNRYSTTSDIPVYSDCYNFTVEDAGIGVYYGIVLDGNSLFLLEDFTVVHNTQQMCIGYALHRIAQNPNILIKVVHVSDDQAASRCRSIRDYIENDPDFKRIAPHIKPTKIWGTGRFIVQRSTPSPDGTLEAYGILSTAIGGRADLVIFDDPQDLKTAVFEPATRAKIEDTFKNVWLTRLTTSDEEDLEAQKSEALLMMNKWSDRDLLAVIHKNPSWAWMTLAIAEDLNSVIYEDSFGTKKHLPLWSKFGKKTLLDRKMTLGTRDFDRGYRLIPFSDSDKTFMYFKQCCHFGVSPFAIVSDEKDWTFIGGIDISGSKRPGTVLSIVACNRRSGVKIPVDIIVMKGSSEIVKEIVRTFRLYGVELFMVENNGVQSTIVDMIETSLGEEKYKKYGIKIEGFCTGSNKADFSTGLPSIDREFEKKEWMFCFQQEPSIEDDLKVNNWSRMYYEMKEHPIYDTSDIVMTLWFCRAGFKQIIRKANVQMIH